MLAQILVLTGFKASSALCHRVYKSVTFGKVIGLQRQVAKNIRGRNFPLLINFLNSVSVSSKRRDRLNKNHVLKGHDVCDSLQNKLRTQTVTSPGSLSYESIKTAVILMRNNFGIGQNCVEFL